ncbi:hypothetical protein [Streptomyces sp. NPDC060027]|uniref:hypothetical protein n=1 Tax=Streptomyces sp. NPDC060027 TaxID=3347040 RepID=UPI003675B700
MKIHAEALLFDNDGTLVSSIESVNRCWTLLQGLRRVPSGEGPVEDAPAGLGAGRSAGMTTVALTTTHQARELDADLVVENLSAPSVLGTRDGVEISVRG